MEEKEERTNELVVTMRCVCKFCGKRFRCGRSLGGHMRSHLVNNTKQLVNSHPQQQQEQEKLSYGLRENPKKTCRFTEKEEEEQEEEELEDSDDDDDDHHHHNKKKKRRSERRRRRRRERAKKSEQEEVAMCLIMLSRDHHRGRVEPSDDDDEKSWSTTSDNNKFECADCNKAFRSYQALGGHRASHNYNNKSNNCLLSLAASTTSESSSVRAISSRHECPICLKVFPSGQALGGHKRSHLLLIHTKKPNKTSVENASSVPKIRDLGLLDLNLPAPDDHDDHDQDNYTIINGLPWLHKHDPLTVPL